jgi:hypothetical protein
VQVGVPFPSFHDEGYEFLKCFLIRFRFKRPKRPIGRLRTGLVGERCKTDEILQIGIEYVGDSLRIEDG